MDERQAQIKEGAGLDESRVNEDLLAFLNKWSFPVLLIIALVSGGYYVLNMVERSKLAKRDEAFAQLGNMESSGSPSVLSLTAIAQEYSGVGSVSELATLQAADIHLNAARTGIDPTDGVTVLTDEDQKFHLDQAETLYQRVADMVSGKPDLELFAVNATFGLAATAESLGDLESAKSRYARAETLATEAGFVSLAKVAAELGSTLGQGADVTLYDADAFPRLPFEPEPEPEPAAESLETTIDVIDDAVEGPEAPEGEVPAVTPEAGTDEDETPAAPAAEPAVEPAVDPEDG